MRVTVKDVSNMDDLINSLKQLGKKNIKVGLFGDGEMVMIGNVHEYGVEIPVTPKMRAWFAYQGYPLKKSTTVIKIPERSWLRTGFDENVNIIAEKVKELMPSLLENKVNPDVFMDAIGSEFVDRIADKIEDLRDPPNKPMTIERKGSSNPLVDTGRLKNSVRHVIE